MPTQPPIGFALVSHRDPDNILRLLRALNRVFDDPPVSIHHDFSQSPLDLCGFGANVAQVERRYKTGWGTIGTALAMVGAIEHLMDRSDAPRWFYLVTGHCYPVLPADKALAVLDSSGCDVFMEQDRFYPTPTDHPRREEWCERYVYPIARLKFPSRRGGWGYRHVVLRHSARRCPFSGDFSCRAGSAHITGNAAAASALTDGFRNRDFVRWYAKRPLVEESSFQTILGNSPGLRLHDGDLRFIVWPDPRTEPDEKRPKTLRASDAQAIAESNAHFARKFLPGESDDLIELIDNELLRR